MKDEQMRNHSFAIKLKREGYGLKGRGRRERRKRGCETIEAYISLSPSHCSPY
jgi:hypothetical protein